MTLNSRSLIALLLTTVLLALGAAGCEKDARALTQEAQIAMIQGDHDVAITTFQAALAKEPGSVDATIGIAETYLRKEDLPKAREWFEKARALKLEKAEEQYLERRFQELLMAEAKPLKDSDPDAYEKKLREVLAVKDRGDAAEAAYEALGDFYLRRADELALDKKTREQAVAYYEQMKTIRTQPATRKQALDKARALRRDIFSDTFARELDKLSESLKRDGLLDEANRRIKVVALIEEKELVFKTDEDKEAIRPKLSRSATGQMIRLTYLLSGTPVPESVPSRFNFETAKVEEELFEKGKAQLTVSVTLAELEELAYKSIILPMERDAEKKGGEAPAGGEAPPASAGEAPASGEAAPPTAAP